MKSEYENNIDLIVDELVKRIGEKSKSHCHVCDNNKEDEDSILVEASGKHVHLCKEHVEMLFGKGYELKQVRELSQPGQYLCEEKVTVIGPKGVLSKVSVLGPVRKETQVELSLTDAVGIGLKAPVRMSGDIDGSESAILAVGKNVISLSKGVIVAKRHIHMTPEDAKKFNVEDKEKVMVRVGCEERSLIFDNVIVRVSPDYNTAMHLDYDEANGCGYLKNMRGKIVK